MADLNSLLQDGIAAARRGDQTTGRRLLSQVIQQDPDNEMAWMWLASCLPRADERRKALSRVLEINPSNERARQAINAMGEDTDTDLSGEAIERLRSTNTGTSRRARAAGTRANRQQQQLLLVGFLVVVILIAVVVLVTQLPGLLAADPTPIPTQTLVAVLTTEEVTPPTPTPQLPEATWVFSDAESRLPTLPPSFTPTPEPSATPLPPPSATPYPQAFFTMVFTSFIEGEAAPSLYLMRGDGTERNELAVNVRDVAFDPSGTRIAFVRDVTIVINEETGETATAPQLFVAPLSNPDAATQLTTYGGSILAQPTWSPEAQEIVFVSNQDGDEELFLINLLSGGIRQLTENTVADRDPAWRPILNSREVLFTSDDGIGLEIFSLHVLAEGQDIPITQVTDTEGSNYAPAWNANGTQIVFVSTRQSDTDIYRMDAVDLDAQLVTRDDGNAEDRSPQFSPDGEYIAFISNRMDDRFQIYAVSPDGEVLTRLTNTNSDDLQLAYAPVLRFRLQE